MKEIFQIRETLIIFYKKNEKWIIPVIKFLIGILVFTLVNKLNYIKEFNQVPIIILMGILTTILPLSLIVFLIIGMIVTQLVYLSIELAVIVGIILLCFLFFYIRIFPKESLLIFAIILAYYFKVPYLVVLVSAISFGVSAIAPIALGTFIWYSLPIIKELSKVGGTTIEELAKADLLEIPSTFANIYMYVINSIKADQTWVISIIIFAMVIFIMYIISFLQIDYSFYIAIGVGAVLNIISFMISTVIIDTNISILEVIVFTLLSTILACIIQFFTRILDYSSAERVQFEDDDSYYYVKIIPKVSISNLALKNKDDKKSKDL